MLFSSEMAGRDTEVMRRAARVRAGLATELRPRRKPPGEKNNKALEVFINIYIYICVPFLFFLGGAPLYWVGLQTKTKGKASILGDPPKKHSQLGKS